jgi:hypothetical protein
LLTEADTPAWTAAACTTAEAFSISADSRNFTLFFGQDVVEAAYGFVQFLAKAFGAFCISFAGISTDSAGTA